MCGGTRWNHVLSTDGDAVVIEGGYFSWTSGGPPCLQRINMKVKTGSLVAVVGHVGSGKSSLLSVILGEMERRCGFVSIKVTFVFILNCEGLSFIKLCVCDVISRERNTEHVQCSVWVRLGHIFQPTQYPWVCYCNTKCYLHMHLRSHRLRDPEQHKTKL